jgi:hypothetical protein
MVIQSYRVISNKSGLADAKNICLHSCMNESAG